MQLENVKINEQASHQKEEIVSAREHNKYKIDYNQIQ